MSSQNCFHVEISYYPAYSSLCIDLTTPQFVLNPKSSIVDTPHPATASLLSGDALTAPVGDPRFNRPWFAPGTADDASPYASNAIARAALPAYAPRAYGTQPTMRQLMRPLHLPQSTMQILLLARQVACRVEAMQAIAYWICMLENGLLRVEVDTLLEREKYWLLPSIFS